MSHPSSKQLVHISLVVFVLFLFSFCKKDYDNTPLPGQPAHPVMQYTNLQHVEVVDMNRKYIDIDADGKSDFFFEVLPVADPLLQRGRLQFYVYSRIHSSLLNADPDLTPALQADDSIQASVPGYDWWEISAPVLAEEITPNNGASYWTGNWKNAAEKYLPVRLRKDSKHYFGWIKMTLDTATRKLILHKAGLSTEADKAVKAGR